MVLSVRIENPSKYRIKSLEVGFSLYANGQKIFDTGIFGDCEDPQFDVDFKKSTVSNVKPPRSK